LKGDQIRGALRSSNCPRANKAEKLEESKGAFKRGEHLRDKGKTERKQRINRKPVNNKRGTTQGRLQGRLAGYLGV
jgi:hypothetical protein